MSEAKACGYVLTIALVWVTYWEISKTIAPKRKKASPVVRRLRRMLALRKVSTLCARHLDHRSGKMSIVDTKNCIKCRRDKL